MKQRHLKPALITLLFTTATLRAQLPPGTQDTTAQHDPQSAQRTAANEALDHQDFPRALKLLTALAEQSPKDPHLLYDLAYTQDALDQTTTA